MLRRAVRGLNFFLGNYGSNGSDACAKDLPRSRDYDGLASVPDPVRDDDIVVKTYRYDFVNRTVEVVRSNEDGKNNLSAKV